MSIKKFDTKYPTTNIQKSEHKKNISIQVTYIDSVNPDPVVTNDMIKENNHLKEKFRKNNDINLLDLIK
jgi:hypothetical protein